MRVTAATRVFAILGDPVEHSLSPAMHNAGFAATGIDAVYVALRPSRDALRPIIETLVRRGGGGNITVPFKSSTAELGFVGDSRVERLGAGNVFAAAGDGQPTLGNVDVDGVLAAIAQLPRADVWTVIGTGGSARAVVGAAVECGARIAVRSRDPERGAAFAMWAASIGAAGGSEGESRLVINATPMGRSPDDPMPIDPARFDDGTAVLDLNYRADEPTQWVHACRARGLAAADGRGVLVAQGVASWRCWFPDRDPPVAVMQAAVDGRMG